MAAVSERLCLTIGCLTVVAMVAGQINLHQTGRDGTSNTITLQCQDTHDQILDNVVFYRNGAILIDDSCFSGSIVSGGSITITVSPPCEGYFSCGEDGGTIVSTPEPIYGMCSPSGTVARLRTGVCTCTRA